MNRNIHEITADFLTLLEMMDDPDIDQEILSDTMAAIKGELEYKLDGYGKIIVEMEGESTALGAEIKRLKERKEAIDKNIGRMKENVMQTMIACGKQKIKTILFNFSVRKNPEKMVVDDQTKVPAYFWEIPKPEPVLNKSRLKDALKTGEIIEGAHLEQGTSLRIS